VASVTRTLHVKVLGLVNYQICVKMYAASNDAGLNTGGEGYQSTNTAWMDTFNNLGLQMSSDMRTRNAMGAF
jgi:hypothetical protein